MKYFAVRMYTKEEIKLLNTEFWDEFKTFMNEANQYIKDDILHKIKNEVNCDILVIGPYISKKVPDFVNDERVETQNILKEFCFLYDYEYFDLSETIKKYDIEVDETHFNDEGIEFLSKEMYNFIIK